MRFSTFETAGTLLQECWRLLDQASRKGRHPMRTPVVGTVGPGGRQAELRTVVLREVVPADRRLVFYTDRRSPKVTQLRRSQHLTWLFYDPGSALQIRASGKVLLYHRDAVAMAAWAPLPVDHRKNYGALLPSGTGIETPGQELPALWADGLPDLQQTEYAFDHFMVVATTVTTIEGLVLKERVHQRARFTWSEEQQDWQGGWVAP